MKSPLRSISTFALFALTALFSATSWPQVPPPAAPSSPHSFRIADGKFLLDGKPVPDHLRRNALRAHPPRLLAPAPAHGQSHGPQHRHHLRLLELPRAAHPASTTSPASTMSPNSCAKRNRKASTSTSAPAPTPALSGSGAASPPGCSRIAPSSCAAPIPNSWTPRAAGFSASARNLRRSSSRTAAPSSPSRSKTSTAPSAATTPTWSRFAATSSMPASANPCSTPPTTPRTFPRAACPTCPPSSTSPPAMPSNRSPLSTNCAPMAPSWPANGGMAGSITGAARTTSPTPSCKPTSWNGSSRRATRSASTWFTAAPASAG